MFSNYPRVSVLIPSYNHAPFISEAIRSVLDQTFTDFELIIVDDTSTDNSMIVINQFKDDRIQIYTNKENKGAVYTLNFAIKQSQGEYIALLNSDDVWEFNKLEEQVKILDKHLEIGAVFTDALFINEEGKTLKKKDFYGVDVFEQENRSNGEWLKKIFFENNCLCHPSILIRRDCYIKTGLYDSALRQLPDFAMWVKLLKTNSIYIIREKLVKFRYHSIGQNSSANTPANRIQNKNEIYLIMKDYFDQMSIDDFIDGFRNFIVKKDSLTPEQVLCEQAFIYFKNRTELSHIYKLIGIEKIHKLLQHEATRETLKNTYQFTENDFFQLTASFENIDAKQLTLSNLVKNKVKTTLEKSPTTYNLIKYYVNKLLMRYNYRMAKDD